jgi:thermostable 8-oxoguanine DNA glycosylase
MRYLIDPHNITDFNRSDEDLEAFWLFCVLVAGKNSQVQAKKLANFLKPAASVGISPFRYIDLRQHKYLDEDIKAEKLGQYKRVHRCFVESLKLDLRNCTVEDLESVFGVGPKTARFFLTHSRPNQQFAVLDTHILKWLSVNLDENVPKVTPNGGKYRELEKKFLEFCEKMGKTPAEMDLEIWSSLNKGIASV